MQNLKKNLKIGCCGLFFNCLVSFAGFADVQPDIVIGSDNRVRLNDGRYPWITFGKIKSSPDETGAMAVCSGTLVGPRHVITSAHCIDVNYNYYFYPSYNNGEYFDTPQQVETNVVTIYSASGIYDMRPGHAPLKPLVFTRETDWALLVLDEDVGNQFGWQEPLAWNAQWLNKSVMYNVAYPAVDASNWYGTYPMLHKNCTIRIAAKDYLWHDCDTNGGSSGSSITTMINDKSYVVAVHNTGYGLDHCTYFKPDACANGAVKTDVFIDTWKKVVKGN